MTIILRFGLLYGLALGVGFYGSHLALGTSPDNFSLGEIIGYSVMIISSLAVVMGIRDYRDKRRPHHTEFLSAFGVGLGITLIASSLFALYNWVYLEKINPEFTQTYIAYTEQQVLSSGLPEEQIQQQLTELAHYAELMSNNVTQSMLMFATVFIIGLLFSLISALAVRTPPTN